MKTILRKCRRLLRYIPVLWNSNDWDYSYAVDLFTMKLEDLADFLESSKAYGSSSRSDASRIRTVVKLLKKVYEDDYLYEFISKFEQLYGEGSLDIKFIQNKQNPEYKKMVYKFEEYENARELLEAKRDLFKKACHRQKRAHKLAWDLVEHNIQRWWD